MEDLICIEVVASVLLSQNCPFYRVVNIYCSSFFEDPPQLLRYFIGATHDHEFVMFYGIYYTVRIRPL